MFVRILDAGMDPQSGYSAQIARPRSSLYERQSVLGAPPASHSDRGVRGTDGGAEPQQPPGEGVSGTEARGCAVKGGHQNMTSRC